MAMTPQNLMGPPPLKGNTDFIIFHPWMLYRAARAFLVGNFDEACHRCKGLVNNRQVPPEVLPLISYILSAAEEGHTKDDCYYTPIKAMSELAVGESPDDDLGEIITQLKIRIYRRFGTLDADLLMKKLYEMEKRQPRPRLPPTSAPMDTGIPNPLDRTHPMTENSDPLPQGVLHRHDAYGSSSGGVHPDPEGNTTPAIGSLNPSPSLDDASICVGGHADWQDTRFKDTSTKDPSKESDRDTTTTAIKANGEDLNPGDTSTKPSSTNPSRDDAATAIKANGENPDSKDTNTKLPSKKECRKAAAAALKAYREEPSSESCSGHTSHAATNMTAPKKSYRDAAASALKAPKEDLNSKNGSSPTSHVATDMSASFLERITEWIISVHIETGLDHGNAGPL